MTFTYPESVAALYNKLTSLVSQPEYRSALLTISSCIFLVIAYSIWKKLQTSKQQLAFAHREITEAHSTIAKLKETEDKSAIREAKLVTMLKAERRSSAEKLALLEEAREELRLQFSTLASEIFEEKSKSFTSHSRERIESLLKPFHNQLDALQNEIRTTYQQDTRERASLKHELTRLQEVNRKMGQETINLTKALKGDKKLQGNWGELVLERVLEQSGLRAGIEFEMQKGFRDNENKLFKPDVIIHLPEGKDVIIDSKVSLSSWDTICACETIEEQQSAMSDLVSAVRNHIRSLGDKKYEELRGIRSLDFIIMFMPIEAAFAAAFTHDEKLYTEAFTRKIIVVSPTTLLATLKTIENLWRYEHQNHNAMEIARKAGTLYDKFRGFLEDLEKLGKQIDNCQHSYDAALSKLTHGRGNLVAQAQQLTELGVQVKKELPKSIVEQVDNFSHLPETTYPSNELRN